MKEKKLLKMQSLPKVLRSNHRFPHFPYTVVVTHRLLTTVRRVHGSPCMIILRFLVIPSLSFNKHIFLAPLLSCTNYTLPYAFPFLLLPI